jgi:hypothetical protein
MAQPPLHPSEPIRLERVDGNYSPVEIAIRQALQGAAWRNNSDRPQGVGPAAKNPIDR